MSKRQSLTPPTLPPDSVSDALADCYAFLLSKLEAKRRAALAEGQSASATSPEAGQQPEGRNA